MALQSLLKRKKIMKTAVQYRILLKIGLISYSENNFQMTNYLQRILFFHCCHIIMLSFCEVKSKIMYNSFILFSSLSLIIDQACSTVFLTQLKFYHLPCFYAIHTYSKTILVYHCLIVKLFFAFLTVFTANHFVLILQSKSVSFI